MAIRYSQEVKMFIAQNVLGTTTSELVVLVNAKFGPLFTISKMKSYKANHKLKSGTPGGLPAGTPSKIFPKEIKEFIEANYKGVGPKEMTERLNTVFGTNYSRKQITAYYKNHNINSGLTGFFYKGHVPANKGIKGIRVSPATEFKKGQTPVNHRPVGSERVDVDGYVWVKVEEPNKWRNKHILNWEKVNGPVPKGHVLIFADGNKQNTAVENLVLITRRQHAVLNHMGLVHRNKELIETALATANLTMKITDVYKKKLKRSSHEQQKRRERL